MHQVVKPNGSGEDKLSPSNTRGWAAGSGGIGSALHEATELDEGAARYINDNLADYLIAVNAHVAELKAILVPEETIG